MKKFILGSVLGVFINTFCFSQKIFLDNLIYGGRPGFLYLGGDDNVAGFYILKPNYKFTLIVTDTNNKIKCVGFGKWKNGRDKYNIDVTFGNTTDMIPVSTNIIYKASNQLSADSCYVRGSILYNDSSTLVFEKGTHNNVALGGILGFDNSKIARANNSGIINSVFEKNSISKITRFALVGNGNKTYSYDFALSKNHNYHEINIVVLRNDSTRIFPVKTGEFVSLDIFKKINGKYQMSGPSMDLMPITKNPDFLINIIKQQIITQPINAHFLKKVLAFIEE